MSFWSEIRARWGGGGGRDGDGTYPGSGGGGGRSGDDGNGGAISEELMAAVRRLEIRTRTLVNDVFGGEYHSVFKGLGMEFAEVREYVPGDEVRAIDWNVTARTGVPHVKRFDEERELTVLFLFDASMSGAYTSGARFKRELGAELVALLAFSAVRNNDKVGLGIFTDRMELYVPPRKGRRHVLRLVRDVLGFRPEHRGSDLRVPLDHTLLSLRRRSVIFVLSDFIGSDFDASFKVLARKHDVIPIVLGDPRERELEDLGLVTVEDLESGGRMVVDTGDARLRAEFAAAARAEEERLTQLFQQARVESIRVSTDGDAVEALIRFFRARARRKAAGR